MTGAWVVWELTMEIRQGTLALRLLRPIHPLVAYSAENLAALPMRGIIALPVVGIVLWTARSQLGADPFLWAVLPLAMLGAWLLTFLVMALIGTLALFLDSATSVFEAWLGISAVLSRYLVPLALLPPPVQKVALVLPFRLLLAFPAEVLLGQPGHAEALR